MECDSPTLKSQGLSMANEIGTTLEACLPVIPHKVLLAASTDDLLHEFAACSTEHRTFKTILVIAHSNQQGLHLTGDREVTCQAGRPWPVKLLFNGLPSLNEIYASPFITNREQAEIVNWLLPVVAVGKGRTNGIDQLIRAAGFIATKGVIWRWTRRDFRRGAIEPQTWDLLLDAAKHIWRF
jgi:hypothetical protein